MNDDTRDQDQEGTETSGGNLVTIGPRALDREMIDQRISTAKRYPRDVALFRKRALAEATIDRETAESCFYCLERTATDKDTKEKKKVKIEGPSVRLAEIAVTNWGNLEMALQVAGEDEDRKNIIGEGMVWDLQNNNRIAVRMQRRITDRYGKRYSEDMVTVTGNAAASLAFRNASFRIVPKTYVNEIFKACKAMAVGNPRDLPIRRKEVIGRFLKVYGVSEERILQKLERKTVEEITLEDLETLIGLGTAIKDGDTTAALAFPENGEGEESSAIGSLKDKVAKKAAEVREPGSEG